MPLLLELITQMVTSINNLVKAITLIYPKCIPDRDYTLSDDGTSISEWLNKKYKQPTTAQIAAALTQLATLQKIKPITQRQLRLWLLNAGITNDQVLAMIAAMPDATQRAQATVEYNYTITFERNNPFLMQVGTALNLTPSQLDDAFIAAGSL